MFLGSNALLAGLFVGLVVLERGTAAFGIHPAIVLGVVVGLGAVGVLAAVLGRYTGWFVVTAAATATFLAMLALILYPQVDPVADLTVTEAAISPLALHLVTVVATVFVPVVVAGFGMLYRVFDDAVDETY